MSNNSTEVVPSTSSSQVAPTLPYDEVEIIVSTVVYVLLGLVIILGNILVIAAFSFNTRLRTINNTFLVRLAVSDLLVGLISIPLWIYVSSCQLTTCVQSVELLTFYSTVDIFTGCASVLQLTTISMERYLALTRPINHRSYSMWILLLLDDCHRVDLCYRHGETIPHSIEQMAKPYSIILTATCFVIPTLVMLTVYAVIYKAARGTARTRVHPAEAPKRPAQNETKIAATIALITGLFVIAWLPFFVVNMLAEFCLPCLPPYPNIMRLVRFVKWMHYSNSIVNPFVYAYRNGEMRKTFKRLLHSCFCCCHGNDYNNFRTSIRTRRTPQMDAQHPSRCHRELRKDRNKPVENGVFQLKNQTDSLRSCPFQVPMQAGAHSSHGKWELDNGGNKPVENGMCGSTVG